MSPSLAIHFLNGLLVLLRDACLRSSCVRESSCRRLVVSAAFKFSRLLSRMPGARDDFPLRACGCAGAASFRRSAGADRRSVAACRACSLPAFGYRLHVWGSTQTTFGVRPSSVQRSSGANSRVSSLMPWPPGTGRSLWPVRPPGLHWFAAVSATLTHGSSVPHFAHWPSVPRWLTGRQSPLAHGPLGARAITTGPLVPPQAHGPSVPGKLTGRQSPVGARAICGLPTRASDLFKLTPFIRVRGTERSPIDCLGIACVRVCF